MGHKTRRRIGGRMQGGVLAIAGSACVLGLLFCSSALSAVEGGQGASASRESDGQSGDGVGVIASEKAAEKVPVREFRVDSYMAAKRTEQSPAALASHQVSLLRRDGGHLRAYDFGVAGESEQPIGEITIYDGELGAFHLLDLERQVRMELGRRELSQLVAQIQTRALRQSGLLKTAASGHFDQITWESPARVRLKSPALSYEVGVLGDVDPHVARAYAEFADAFARWNTFRNGLPPKARFALNDQLAQREVVPQTVLLTVELAQGRRQHVSRHEYAWSWNAQDRRQVQQFDAALGQFRAVTPREFLRLAAAER